MLKPLKPNTNLLLLTLGLLAAMAFETTASASDLYRVKAKLFGQPPIQGNVIYREDQQNEGLRRRFKVEVRQAPAFQTYQVHLNGNFVGSLSTNQAGFGEFQLRTPQFIDDPGDGFPMPDDFPRVLTTDTVTVGPLSGVFFDRLSNPTNAQWFKLFGRTDAAGQLNVRALYRERWKNFGLRREFKAKIEHGQPNTSVSVTVNGEFVGTITTNAFGNGSLKLRTAAFIDDPGDGQPMPNSFPSLHPGDVVRIGTLDVVLQVD